MTPEQIQEAFDDAVIYNGHQVDVYPVDDSIYLEGRFTTSALIGKIQAAALREAADELAIQTGPGVPWGYELATKAAMAKLHARAQALDPQE